MVDILVDGSLATRSEPRQSSWSAGADCRRDACMHRRTMFCADVHVHARRHPAGPAGAPAGRRGHDLHAGRARRAHARRRRAGRRHPGARALPRAGGRERARAARAADLAGSGARAGAPGGRGGLARRRRGHHHRHRHARGAGDAVRDDLRRRGADRAHRRQPPGQRRRAPTGPPTCSTPWLSPPRPTPPGWARWWCSAARSWRRRAPARSRAPAPARLPRPWPGPLGRVVEGRIWLHARPLRRPALDPAHDQSRRPHPERGAGGGRVRCCGRRGRPRTEWWSRRSAPGT